MRTIGNTMSAGESIRNAQANDQPFSKDLIPGMSYRLFFKPAYMDDGNIDICAAVVPGRNLDAKAVGMSFYPLEDFDLTDQNKIIDKSGLDRLSRVARVYFEACYRKEAAEADEFAKREAEKTGEKLDQVALAAAVKKITTAYKGDQEAEPAIMPSKNMIISPVRIVNTVQVLVVPFDSEKGPDLTKMRITQLDLKRKKQTQLCDILNEPLYRNDEDKILEVIYNYSGDTKKSAGMNASFQGVSADTSIATRFPKQWEAIKKDWLPRMAEDDQTIAARNSQLSREISARAVEQAIVSYLSNQKMTLTYFDWESDEFQRLSPILMELKIGKGLPKVEGRIKEIAEAYAQKNGMELQPDGKVVRHVSKEDITNAVTGDTELSAVVSKYLQGEDGMTDAELEEMAANAPDVQDAADAAEDELAAM